MNPVPLIVPWWLIHSAVAAVWLYEGFWCKLLGQEPNQTRIVAAVPRLGLRFGGAFLKTLGMAEVMLAVWVVSRVTPILCALTQTGLLIALNTAGYCLRVVSSTIQPDGSEEFRFVVLVWISASSSHWL